MKPLLKPKSKIQVIEPPLIDNGRLTFDERYEHIFIPKKEGSFEFSPIVQEAKRMQDKCFDTTVINSAKDFIIHNNMTANITSHDYSLTQYSLGQLCNRLEVPFSYIKKCCTNDKTSLAEENLNRWLQHTDKSYFFRMYGNQIRGILSTRYSQFDVPEILDVLDSTLDFDQYKIKGYTLNPERFHLRLVGDKLDIPNEDIFAGIQVDSSDVGRSRLAVQFFIYKQVCTNGLMRTYEHDYLFIQRHINITKDVFAQEFSDSMKRIPEIAAEAVENVLSASRKRLEIPDNINEFNTKTIRFETGLPDDIIKRGVELMKHNYTPTVWGLINGLTEVSKEYTLEKRLDIERRAGLLLAA